MARAVDDVLHAVEDHRSGRSDVEEALDAQHVEPAAVQQHRQPHGERVPVERFVQDERERADVAALEARLRALNPLAAIRRVAFGAIAPGELLRARDHDLPRATARAPLPNVHAHDVQAFSVVLDEPLDWDAFAVWLTMLLHSRGLDVLRVKGLLDVGEPGPVVLDGVQHVVHRPRHLDAWPDDDHRTRIVFITRGIEREAMLASLRAFAGLGAVAIAAVP